MCGVAGLYLESSERNLFNDNTSDVIRRMTSALSARGPDSQGHLLIEQVALGHCRLSILELSEAGAQPMRIGDDGSAISHNGEVYNFLQLRNELKARGCTFRGHSDTEVILEAYNHWGLLGLKRLEGIFAFAIWDPAKRRLILMRDRLGVKPLFYGESDYGLAFGSEIKAVLEAGGVDTRLDDQSFSEYLWYGNTYGDRTFYKGVRALEPGHWMIIEGGNRRVEPWWRIEEWLEQPTSVHNLKNAAKLVQESLDQAVTRQLVADVPVGIFLSGGVDSSAIAASAMQQRSSPLDSYAAGFDFDRGINELPKAASVARHLGLRHNELQVSGAELEEVLTVLAQSHGEPFADAANIPLYLMCRELDGKIKVVLQGDGGDELFAGYRRYALLRNSYLLQMLPASLSRVLRVGGSYGRRAARLIDIFSSSDCAELMALLLTVETKYEPPELLMEADRRYFLASSTDPFLAYRDASQRFSEQDPVQKMLLTDLVVQLPSQFLTKVDRATMASGIEARVPLLDEGLVKLAVSMPSIWKVRGTEKKLVLRDSQRGRLPDVILDGPKTGFGVPYQHWLRTSLFEHTRAHLLDYGFLEAFAFNGNAVEKALKIHQNGEQDRGFTLWKLLQLAIWHGQR